MIDIAFEIHGFSSFLLLYLSSMQVPEGVDWAKLTTYVMEKYRCLLHFLLP